MALPETRGCARSRGDGRLPEANAFRPLAQRAGGGPGFGIQEAEGSPRHAAERAAYVGIGSVPVGAHKLFCTTDVRADLSSPSAVVGFEVLTQSATRFAILLRQAEGSWVRGGQPDAEGPA